MTTTAISIDELSQFFQREFPQANFVIETLGDKSATIRQPIDREHLRPGGTVSGPTLMTLADTVIYVAILGELGLVALAVTTSLNINFLRKPAADADIIVKCHLIKLGKNLAVGEVYLYSDGMSEPVAHATGTYAIPAKR